MRRALCGYKATALPHSKFTSNPADAPAHSVQFLQILLPRPSCLPTLSLAGRIEARNPPAALSRVTIQTSRLRPWKKTRIAISIVSEVARIVSTASLGLFAGGMLTEGCVLVPYWRSLKPADFFEWYAANGRRLQGFFGPLTSVTALLALAAGLLSLWEGHPGGWLAVLAAAVSLAVVATFLLYFQKANASFASASLRAEDVAAQLARWAKWHWWRTGLSFVALASAMMSLWRFR